MKNRTIIEAIALVGWMALLLTGLALYTSSSASAMLVPVPVPVSTPTLTSAPVGRLECLPTCEEADEYVRRCGCMCRTHLYIRDGGIE
jgi:hypothetical protein